MVTKELTSVSATYEDGGFDEPSPGYCSHNYDLEITVGEETQTVGGWHLCGFLRPGAHADLDGSGLALWGDNQPGGWRVVDSDGQCTGLPRVDDREPNSADEPIRIIAGEGSTDVCFESDCCPQWAAAANEYHGLLALVYPDDGEESDEYDEQIDAAHDAMESIRNDLIERIQHAIDDAVEEPDPPDDEDVYEALDTLDGETLLPIRIGDWNGAGVLLAWHVEAGGKDVYEYTYWPDRDDIERAVEAVKDGVVDELEAIVEVAKEEND